MALGRGVSARPVSPTVLKYATSRPRGGGSDHLVPVPLNTFWSTLFVLRAKFNFFFYFFLYMKHRPKSINLKKISICVPPPFSKPVSATVSRCEICLFVCGISLTSGQPINELFPDCLKVVLFTSCFMPWEL